MEVDYGLSDDLFNAPPPACYCYKGNLPKTRLGVNDSSQ